jgi:hypothetical protein
MTGHLQGTSGRTNEQWLLTGATREPVTFATPRLSSLDKGIESWAKGERLGSPVCPVRDVLWGAGVDAWTRSEAWKTVEQSCLRND